MDLVPLWLSLKLAFVTTAVLVIMAAPLTYLLVYVRFTGKSFFEALLSLPMVLPPTVLGFYLLLVMTPQGNIGRFWKAMTGSPLIFTFAGIVAASLVYSLPFAIQPMKAAFEKIDRRLLESSYVLGLSPMATFFKVIIPNAVNGLAASAILVFIHTLGEFGVILMVGGSIPGETRVASIAIYEAVEALRYGDAAIMCLILVPISYLFLLLINRLTRRQIYGA
jgi:molybdate transport system permease protein